MVAEAIALGARLALGKEPQALTSLHLGWPHLLPPLPPGKAKHTGAGAGQTRPGHAPQETPRHRLGACPTCQGVIRGSDTSSMLEGKVVLKTPDPPPPGAPPPLPLGPSCAPCRPPVFSQGGRLPWLCVESCRCDRGSVLGHLPSPQHPCLSRSENEVPAHFVLPWARPPSSLLRPDAMASSPASSRPLRVFLHAAAKGQIWPRPSQAHRACGTCPTRLAGLASLA